MSFHLLLILEVTDTKYTSPTHQQNADADFSALDVLISGIPCQMKLFAVTLSLPLKDISTTNWAKHSLHTLTKTHTLL